MCTFIIKYVSITCDLGHEWNKLDPAVHTSPSQEIPELIFKPFYFIVTSLDAQLIHLCLQKDL